MSRDQRDYLLALLDPTLTEGECARVPVVPGEVAAEVEGRVRAALAPFGHKSDRNPADTTPQQWAGTDAAPRTAGPR